MPTPHLPVAARPDEPLASASCDVVRRTTVDGTCIVKTYPSRRGFTQERAALDALAPDRILAVDPERRRLFLRDLPGTAPPTTAAVHHQAGAWLRSLHDRPFRDNDPFPVHEAMVRRGAAVGCRVEVPAAARVRCHRDFRPANWLWHDGRLTVIDFEHSRGDHPLWDLVKLATEVWPERPDLREAFRDGYGGWDDDVLQRLVRLFDAQTRARRR